MNETINGLKSTLVDGFEKVASAYDIPEEFREEARDALAAELDGLEKEASFGTQFLHGAGHALKRVGGLRGTVGSRLAAGAGAGAVMVGGVLAADAIRGLASMAVNKVGQMYGASSNRAAYEQAFRTALGNSEILQNDREKAKHMADTIFGFAPTVASDANLLTNILTNSIHGDSMDLQTVRAVTELEEKFNKMKANKMKANS